MPSPLRRRGSRRSAERLVAAACELMPSCAKVAPRVSQAAKHRTCVRRATGAARRKLDAYDDDHRGGSMNTQTNQWPADGRLSKQQANDRGGGVSWGEHVSDDVRIRPSLVWREAVGASVGGA